MHHCNVTLPVITIAPASLLRYLSLTIQFIDSTIPSNCPTMATTTIWPNLQNTTPSIKQKFIETKVAYL